MQYIYDYYVNYFNITTDISVVTFLVLFSVLNLFRPKLGYVSPEGVVQSGPGVAQLQARRQARRAWRQGRGNEGGQGWGLWRRHQDSEMGL